MATWVIGDVQGCFATLERLLERLPYDAARDQLWFVGDLVNRGVNSLEMLRWISRQDESRVRAVLGNHDLHLLACAEKVRRPKGLDTLDEVLVARDRIDLIDWLAARPLCFVERVERRAPGGIAELERASALERPSARLRAAQLAASDLPARVLVVHAGVLPVWDLPRIEELSREAEAELRAARKRTLEGLQEDVPDRWTDDMSRRERARFTLATLTRIRTVVAPDEMDSDFSGAPEEAPRGRRPWFELWPEHGGRATPDVGVAFGHWAALDLRLAPRALGLDSGCVWGRLLSAVRLEDRAVVQEPAAKRDLK